MKVEHSTCGDTDCGGIGAEIRKDEYYYYWIFGENENRLSYKFDADEYKNEFVNYLKGNNILTLELDT